MVTLQENNVKKLFIFLMMISLKQLNGLLVKVKNKEQLKFSMQDLKLSLLNPKSHRILLRKILKVQMK